jgi:hypothetical protein
MGHAQITTTQKYLHALPDADQRNLDASTGSAPSGTPTPTTEPPGVSEESGHFNDATSSEKDQRE